MNGGHDLGGMMGFGPVVPEPGEPVFHAEWERRVFAMALAMGFTGTWSLDASRSAREDMPPAEYLSASYYAIWHTALERQIVENALATPDEIAHGTPVIPARPVTRVLRADAVGPRFGSGFPSDRPAPGPARYAVGDAVVARNIHPVGHTRLPRYVRGRTGTIERMHGAFVFPDTNARGAGESPQWLYTVGFTATALWGETGAVGDYVIVAAFESYLEPAGTST
ncbi:nitrile hydratase subunit beta [Methylobacterium sp. BTF04]|uniref:nitrile hydratase subunit beta n=1 Tax=Methylobacterium sp. BTF04 TaxID=2708300 RepID=UPI0013D2AC59|nr:nitrile hydratase subunit beta [Methylobacterium sp. BTF04]